MESTDSLQQAIDYAREGNRTMASRLLARYVTHDPQNDTAWLWLAACLDDPEKQRYCLKKANEINPNNPVSINGLSAFLTARSEKAAKPVKPARVEAIPMPAPEPTVEPVPEPQVTSEPLPTPARGMPVVSASKKTSQPGLTQTQKIILAVLIAAIVIIIAILAYMVFVADPTFLPSLFQSFMGG